MRQADLVVATGSQANVRAAYSSGTPAIGVGAGNVVVIVDETADLADAARQDRALQDLRQRDQLLVGEQRDRRRRGLRRAARGARGARAACCSTRREGDACSAAMFPDGKLSPAVTAQPAGADRARSPGSAAGGVGRALPDGRGNRHRARASVLGREAVAGAGGLSRARLRRSRRAHRGIYDYQGDGHSVGIHTRRRAARERLGLELPVCRVIVNQAHCFATGGSFDNALPFSLSMGCGTWGGNSFSDNLELPALPQHHARRAPDAPARARTHRGRALRGVPPRARRMTFRDAIGGDASRTPDAPFAFAPETGATMTWRGLDRRRDDIAATGSLPRWRGGCAPGDIVAFMLPNGCRQSTVFRGAMAGGYVVAPINLLAQDAHLDYMLGHAQPARRVRDAPSMSRRLDAACARIGAPTRVIEVDAGWPRAACGAAARARCGSPPTRPRCSCTPRAPPGLPKGVLLTHANMLYAGAAVARTRRSAPHDRVLSSLPLYHINGQCIATVERARVRRQPRHAAPVQRVAMVAAGRALPPDVAQPRAHDHRVSAERPRSRARTARGAARTCVLRARRRRRCRRTSNAHSSRASAFR